MKFVVLASDSQWNSLQNNKKDIEWIRVNSFEDFLSQKSATAYFNLLDDAADQEYNVIDEIIFINSITKTLIEIEAKPNIIRINGWNGFIEKELWEISGNITSEISMMLKHIGKKFITVDDEPGFVSARVIAMIINEAYFATEENVSTEAEIDIAMKLGTNYPYGPFEWANVIGVSNIYALLKKLAVNDSRYNPSKALQDLN